MAAAPAASTRAAAVAVSVFLSIFLILPEWSRSPTGGSGSLVKGKFAPFKMRVN